MTAVVVVVAIAVVVIALVLVRLARVLVATITVFEWAKALKYRKGRFVSVVGPGRYRFYRQTTTFDVVDMRPSILTIVGQELVTSDGATVKLSLAAVYRVIDPKLARSERRSAEELLYLELQMALRSLITTKGLDELLDARGSMKDELMKAVSGKAAELGLELTSADLKDVSLSSELRKAYAQTVLARKEGQAALERARGETAALRNLANAASMLADRPELLQLRLLQQLEALSGHTLVFGMQPDGLHLRAAPDKPEKTKG
jgi:regulator of protease activity HflC (stomatin/prohibitin superfamily)